MKTNLSLSFSSKLRALLKPQLSTRYQSSWQFFPLSIFTIKILKSYNFSFFSISSQATSLTFISYLWTQKTNPNSSASSPSSQQITSTHSISNSHIQIILPITTKLDRSNYLTWKSQIHPLPHSYGLTKYVKGRPPPPTMTSQTSQLAFNPEFLPLYR